MGEKATWEDYPEGLRIFIYTCSGIFFLWVLMKIIECHQQVYQRRHLRDAQAKLYRGMQAEEARMKAKKEQEVEISKCLENAAGNHLAK